MNLQKIRKELKKTQLEVAKQLFIDPTTMCNYEKGKSEPSIETLIKLANYYNVSLDYLVGREQSKEIITTNYKEKKELLLISEKLNSNNFQKLLIYGTALLDAQEA